MRAAELAFDVVTAVLSLADIGLDLAVAIEFHNAGRSTYFQLSIAIFLLAQASYAFLFVATYGAELSNRRKVYSFLLALPFAQAVPVFTLIESFHFNFISNGLRSFGLRPTGSPAPAPRPCTGGGGGTEDSLWVLVQRKYHAHAGFLAEALLEAVLKVAVAYQRRWAAARPCARSSAPRDRRAASWRRGLREGAGARMSS